jgi:hypothetical protein
MAGEVFRVFYRQDGKDLNEGFNSFDLERLQEFVEEHEVTSVEFSFSFEVQGKNPTARAVKCTIAKENVSRISPEWVDARRNEMMNAL